MKVYSCPTECPAPKIDFSNPNWEDMDELEQEHQEKLKAHLKSIGFTGKYTGEIVMFGVADGHAQYMMADGPKSFLIHLPYGDAWNYRDIKFIPKIEIIKRINQQNALINYLRGR